MKKKLRIINVLLALVLAFSLNACATASHNNEMSLGDNAVIQKVPEKRIPEYNNTTHRKDPEIVANLFITLYDERGNIKDYREYHNIVTTAGKSAAIKQILGDVSNGAQPAKFNYIGVGTDATSEGVNDTALGAEIGTRQQDTSPDLTGGQGVLIVTFAAGNATGAITESGVFNASSSGTLLARKTFSVINKGSSDALQITWTITVN